MKNPFAVALQTLALLVLLAVLLLAFTGVSSAAPLAPRATLLISLDTIQEQKKPLLGWLYRDYSRRISDKFRKILGRSDLELEIIDRANLHDLARELKNPSNVALFWLSHASDPRKILSAPAGAVDPVILDAHGSDVKRLFAGAHPNLRWLSVIACSSALILDETGSVSDPEQPLELERGESRELTDIAPGIPPLIVQRFAVKKGAILAMREAAGEARRYFKSLPEVRAGYQLPGCTDADAPAPSVEVRRLVTSTQEHPALGVLWEKQLLGTIPGLKQAAQENAQHAHLNLGDALPLLRAAAQTGKAQPIEVSSLFTGARKYARDFDLGDITLTLRLPRPVPYKTDLEIPLARINKTDGSALGTVTHLFEIDLDSRQKMELREVLAQLPEQKPDRTCPAISAFRD